MHGCEGSAWLDGSGKVGRQAVSGRIFLLRSVFSPKTLPMPAIRLKSIRQRKQATDGKSEKRREERLTNEAGYWCFICKPFLSLFAESPLLTQS